MTEQAEDPAPAPEPAETVKVTVAVPVNLLADYDREVAAGFYAGFYASRDEALRHGLIESWRHHRGRYCTVRLDLLDPADNRPDTSASGQPDTAEPNAGGAEDTVGDWPRSSP